MEREEKTKQQLIEEIENLYQELDRRSGELKKLDDMKSDFVSHVSHELRTPLTPIRESVSLIYDGVLGEINEKQKRALFIGLRNIDRLTRLINSLLDMSKLEAGKFEIDKEQINIVELAEGVIETFLAQAKNKGLTLKINSPEKDIRV